MLLAKFKQVAVVSKANTKKWKATICREQINLRHFGQAETDRLLLRMRERGGSAYAESKNTIKG